MNDYLSASVPRWATISSMTSPGATVQGYLNAQMGPSPAMGDTFTSMQGYGMACASCLVQGAGMAGPRLRKGLRGAKFIAANKRSGRSDLHDLVRNYQIRLHSEINARARGRRLPQSLQRFTLGFPRYVFSSSEIGLDFNPDIAAELIAAALSRELDVNIARSLVDRPLSRTEIVNLADDLRRAQASRRSGAFTMQGKKQRRRREARRAAREAEGGPRPGTQALNTVRDVGTTLFDTFGNVFGGGGGGGGGGGAPEQAYYQEPAPASNVGLYVAGGLALAAAAFFALKGG